MRIAIDIRSLVEPFPSGISEYTYQVVKNLLAIDKENDYLLFCNSHRPFPEHYKKAFFQSGAQLRLLRWPSKLFNTSLFIGAFLKLDRLLGGVDIFFMPNLNFCSFSKKCRTILTVHDLSFSYPGFYSKKGYWWHRFIKPQQTLKRADKIIAVSESTKNDLQNIFNISSDNITVIYSGVETERFQKIDQAKLEDIKRQYHLEKPFYLYLGNVEKRKNIEGLIKAWQLLRKRQQTNYQLVIAGRMMQKNLQEKYPQVNFTGYVMDEDKPYLYHLAKAFVYPSFYEGFGLPVLEAMAAGCPVITSFSTALPEIASDSVLLVDPYNIEEISCAMHQLITDKELSQNLINKAKSLVLQYTWKKTAQVTLNAFKSVNEQ